MTDLSTKKIPVMEVFGPTVQGEGAVIGLQTYFIRFGLCDYKCKMCDSMHAVDPDKVSRNASWWTQTQIAEEFLKYRRAQGEHTTNWVTFSGGNPCIHDLRELVTALQHANINIQVETQGTFVPDWLFGCSHVVVSPKGPGMGERYDQGKLDFFMDSGPKIRMSMKVVIFDERDLEFASLLYERYVLVRQDLRESQFFLSLGNPMPPGKDQNVSRSHLRTLLMDRYDHLLRDVMKHQYLCNVKFLPQMHVLVWGNKAGV
jgi:7-carboxy-7-deazaguanine synthase